MNRREILKKFSSAKFVSPYRLAKIESELRGRTIVPQKIYGYVRKNYIAADLNSTGKIEIKFDEAVRYLERQLSRDEKLANKS
jgi:hypothetical protein